MTQPIQIPAVSFWAAITGFAAAIGTGVLSLVKGQARLQRQLDTKMSHEEHARICEKRQDELRESLGEIKDMLRHQDDEATEHRHKVATSLSTLQLDVGVLKERLRHTVRDEGL